MVTMAIEIMKEEVITIEVIIGTEITHHHITEIVITFHHITADLMIMFQDHTITDGIDKEEEAPSYGTKDIHNHNTADMMNIIQDHTITDGIDTRVEIMAYTTLAITMAEVDTDQEIGLKRILSPKNML